MRRFALAIILTVVLSAPFSALAVTIDFDSLTGGPIGSGDLVTNQYSGLGVTFIDTYTGGAHANNTLTSKISGASSPNVLWVAQGGGGQSDQYLEIDFSYPINSFSFVFGTSLDSDIALTAYNGATVIGGGSTVGATQIDDVLSGQFAFGSSSPFTSVRLFSTYSQGGNSFNFSIDNVTLPSPVPEPSLMLFLGFGLVGVAGLRRTVKR